MPGPLLSPTSSASATVLARAIRVSWGGSAHARRGASGCGRACGSDCAMRISLFAALYLSSPAPARQPCIEAPLFSGNIVIPGVLNGPTVQWRTESRALGDFSDDGRLDMVMGDSYGKLIF